MAWLFVPGLEGWNSALESPSDMLIELCVTSSGKPTRRLASWPAWKNRPWISRLSGTTSQPSMAACGVVSWTSSLRENRASRSHSLASEGGPAILATCGLKLPALSERWNPALYSLRTSQEQLTLGMDTRPSSKAWATELRRDYSARRKLARHRNAYVSSYWPTPAARDYRTAGGSGFLARRLAASTRGQPLNEMARECSRQVQKTSTVGGESLLTIRKLNPLFVEMLMGLPFAWTDCEQQVTGLSLWLRRWRSLLYGGG